MARATLLGLLAAPWPLLGPAVVQRGLCAAPDPGMRAGEDPKGLSPGMCGPPA